MSILIITVHRFVAETRINLVDGDCKWQSAISVEIKLATSKSVNILDSRLPSLCHLVRYGLIRIVAVIVTDCCDVEVQDIVLIVDPEATIIFVSVERHLLNNVLCPLSRAIRPVSSPFMAAPWISHTAQAFFSHLIIECDLAAMNQRISMAIDKTVLLDDFGSQA